MTKKLVIIENGTANIIVGTHALIQDDVNFNKLGFVVIDEQHKFRSSSKTNIYI